MGSGSSLVSSWPVWRSASGVGSEPKKKGGPKAPAGGDQRFLGKKSAS